ncbi:hypothetical protein IFR05_017423, partial [Cadophora sp. M221]
MESGIRDNGAYGDGKVDLEQIITKMRLFLDSLQKLNNTPKTVKRLMKDVEFINASLKLLQNVKDREWGLLG